MERLGEAGWEYKIDGARIRVHDEASGEWIMLGKTFIGHRNGYLPKGESDL